MAGKACTYRWEGRGEPIGGGAIRWAQAGGGRQAVQVVAGSRNAKGMYAVQSAGVVAGMQEVQNAGVCRQVPQR